MLIHLTANVNSTVVLSLLFCITASISSAGVSADDFEDKFTDEIAAYEEADKAAKLPQLITLLKQIIDDYPGKALDYIHDAQETIANGTAERRLEVDGIMCWSYYSVGRYTAAKKQCSAFLANAKQLDQKDSEARAYNALGLIENDLGNVALALGHLHQSSIQAQTASMRATALNHAGSIHKESGAFEQAFQHFSKAVRSITGSDLSPVEKCDRLATSYFETADINRSLGQRQEAIHYYELALACSKTSDFSWDQVAALSLLTSLYLEEDNIATAADYSKEAQRIAQPLEALIRSMAARARADVLNRTGQVSEANILAESAVALAKGQNDSRIHLSAVLLLSKLHAEKQRYAQALQVLSDFEADWGDKLQRFQALRVLAVKPELYRQNGQLDLAFESQQRYIELSREILNSTTLQRVSVLQTELGLREQIDTAQRAELQQQAAEARARQATITRNLTLVGGIGLFVIGYLLISRRNQAQQVAQSEQARALLKIELADQAAQLTEQARAQLNLQTRALQAQKLEAIGHLTGGIAHDFNNLMAVVIGEIESVCADMDTTLGESERQSLRNAIGAASSGGDIAHQLLAYARQQPLQAMPTEISALLDDAAPIFGHALDDRIELTTKLSDGPIWCEIDRAQLVTALLNLVINSKDAIHGTGAINLSCKVDRISADHPTLGSGTYCVLELQDTGSGIAPDDLQHVVEPFYTRKDSGTGHGLGLSMVYGFARQSSGDLDIQSVLGQGTTVKLWLPTCNAPIAGPVAPAGRATDEIHEGSNTVLVVEDQESVLQMAQGLLERLGYQVETAHNGEIAQQKIESGYRPALVFSDISMPGELDGIQLALWLRSFAPEIRVLLTSGYPQEGLEQTSAGFLAKPYRLDQLQEALAKTRAQI